MDALLASAAFWGVIRIACDRQLCAGLHFASTHIM
jgi:hypothetical protein